MTGFTTPDEFDPAAAQQAGTGDKTTGDFKRHYDRLEAIERKLSHNQVTDVDELMPLVEEAIASYNFCNERIEVVKAQLQALDGKMGGAARSNPDLSSMGPGAGSDSGLDSGDDRAF